MKIERKKIEKGRSLTWKECNMIGMLLLDIMSDYEEQLERSEA